MRTLFFLLSFFTFLRGNVVSKKPMSTVWYLPYHIFEVVRQTPLCHTTFDLLPPGLTDVLSKGDLCQHPSSFDASTQGRSLYFERIDLSPKLRKLNWKLLASRQLLAKVPLLFSDNSPSNPIVCKFCHFQPLFSLQNPKTTYSLLFKAILIGFHFLAWAYSGIKKV